MIRLRESFQIFFHFAQRAGLSERTLLQIFLLCFQLLFQRLDQSFNRFLPLRQIAFGRFLKFSETLLREPQKFRRGLFQRIRAQGFERVAQIFDRFFLRQFGSRKFCSCNDFCSARIFSAAT